MESLWFILVAVTIVAYVVLDGFDLGTGIVHLSVARSDAERGHVLQTIGPFWDGNEVWLLAAGGTMFFAFPTLYASSFSGFYLPLMVVLWLLMFRGIAIEFRSHVNNLLWRTFWDVAFAASSTLLSIFFGAALGNVIRGVPLDRHGDFFLPFWTNFGVHGEVGILDWYTVTVGVLAYLTLAQHGALWLAFKSDSTIRDRSIRLAGRLWWLVVAFMVITTMMTLEVQPVIWSNLSHQPWRLVFPAIALIGLGGARYCLRHAANRNAFFASCLYIIGMLGSAAFGLYPMVLPSNGDPALSLTIYNSATSRYGLEIGLIWWIPGVLLATAYFYFLFRHFAKNTL